MNELIVKEEESIDKWQCGIENKTRNKNRAIIKIIIIKGVWEDYKAVESWEGEYDDVIWLCSGNLSSEKV